MLQLFCADLGTLRGIIATVLFISFAALCAHAFNPRRRAEFESFSRIPLEEAARPGDAP